MLRFLFVVEVRQVTEVSVDAMGRTQYFIELIGQLEIDLSLVKAKCDRRTNALLLRQSHQFIDYCI